MSQSATSTAPIARYVVARLRCQSPWYRRSRSRGSWPITTGLRNWISDSPSRWAPRWAEPRNACPSTPSSVFIVSRPSWLLPLNRPVCRPYVVAGISVQANRVSVRSVIFTRRRLRSRWSSRRQVRPERVGAALRDRAPELDGPLALAAELGAPRPQAPRHELQRVLVGEADRAVRLMSDRRADPRRLADSHLGHRDLERGVAAVGGAKRVGRRRARGRRVPGKHRQILLDHLEGADRLSELAPLGRVLRGLAHKVVEAARHLGGARQSAVEPDRVRRHARARGRRGDDRGRVERQRVARLTGEVLVGRDLTGAVGRRGAPRHPRGGAAEAPAAAGASESQRIFTMDWRHRQWPGRYVQPGLG